MCNPACIDFVKKTLTRQDIETRSILEVGSLDVNGSARHFIESLDPECYIGVDIIDGPGVDLICRADDLVKQFGHSSFDVVLSTEMLEHVRDWRRVVSNLKEVLRPGGRLLITTRSFGFEYHGFPYDFWRYELSDFRKIFADFEIEDLQEDPMSPGVFIIATKPYKFTEQQYDMKLYSIITTKREYSISDISFVLFKLRYHSHAIIKLASRIIKYVLRKINLAKKQSV